MSSKFVICRLETGHRVLGCQWCCANSIAEGQEFVLQVIDRDVGPREIEVVCPWCFNFGADRPSPPDFDGVTIDREVHAQDPRKVRCSKCMTIGHFHEECKS